MPLKLYKRPNGIYHIRGVVQGQRFDNSSKTRVRSEAEAIRAKWEADAFKRAVYGERAVGTFADAVAAYILAGGEAAHLDPLLDAFGTYRLTDITQIEVDKLAAKSAVKPATHIRRIYTPLLAGGALIRVPAAYSSQTCQSCGIIDARSRESQAVFRCVACGHEDHADTNAALEILRRSTSGLLVEGSRWRPGETRTTEIAA